MPLALYARLLIDPQRFTRNAQSVAPVAAMTTARASRDPLGTLLLAQRIGHYAGVLN